MDEGRYSYGYTDSRIAYGAVKQERYELVHRYGKWRVMDTTTNKMLTQASTKELAEAYLKLLRE